jgi:hypothetical protein
MIKQIIIGAIVASLAGCSSFTPNKETRFTTSVTISEYNNLASEYMHKPTFGTIQHFDDYDAYYLRADRYGQGYLGIYITPENIEHYETALNKYLKWNDIALESKDLIDKTIVSFNQTMTTWKLNFFSGNEHSHYFNVLACSDGLIETCTTMATLDSSNVRNLITELDKFKANSLSKQHAEDKYN